MAERPSAVYDERTTANVIRCLAQNFDGATAIGQHEAADKIIQMFSCQRVTANKLLKQAFDDGELYRLRFLEGALWKIERAGFDDIAVEGFPHFVTRSNYGRGLEHDDDRNRYNSRVADGAVAVALPEVFDEWLDEYREQYAADQARVQAEREAEKEAERAALPELVPLLDYSIAWKESADRRSKRQAVEVRAFPLQNGTPVLTLQLISKKVNAMAPELLELLRKHFGEPPTEA